MQNGDDKGVLREIREKLRTNVLLQALPYTLLISALTIAGLFGGFAFGKRWGSSSVMDFACSLFFALLGFFLGLLISYLIVSVKYPWKED